MARSDAVRGRLVLLACAGALSLLFALAACNSILGLNDFDYVECSGGRCGDGSMPIDATADAGDGSIIDAQDETPGAPAAVWARWPMPNYDGGPGVLPNPTKYDAGAGEIIDDVTGLVWQQAASTSSVPFSGAPGICTMLPNGPWRLPKRIELVSLLDFGTTSPFIGAAFSVPKEKIWTSSAVQPFDAGAPSYWIVDFEGGAVTTSPTTPQDVHSVLCVKDKS